MADAVDNQGGNQPAAPAPVAEPVKDVVASRSAEIRSTAQKAMESLRSAPAPAAAEPKPEPKAEATTTEFPKLVREEPKKEEAVEFDPTKLSPELQAAYKSMQADYTRKTQGLADERKRLDALLEKALAAAEPKPVEPKVDAPPVQDPREQIKLLREEGRHEEADNLLIRVIQEQESARISALENEATMNNKRAAFRDTITDVELNNPVFKAYKEDTAKIFNSADPTVVWIRDKLLKESTPDVMKAHLPKILDIIARGIQGIALRQNMEARIKAGIAEGIAAEKAAAAKLPTRLVESGSGPREAPSTQSKDGNIREATRAALAQLTGH